MNSLKEEIFDILKNDVMFYKAELLTSIILSKFENHLSNLWDKNRKLIVVDADLSDDFKEGYDEAINDIITNIIISEPKD